MESNFTGHKISTYSLNRIKLLQSQKLHNYVLKFQKNTNQVKKKVCHKYILCFGLQIWLVHRLLLSGYLTAKPLCQIYLRGLGQKLVFILKHCNNTFTILKKKTSPQAKRHKISLLSSLDKGSVQKPKRFFTVRLTERVDPPPLIQGAINRRKLHI